MPRPHSPLFDAKKLCPSCGREKDVEEFSLIQGSIRTRRAGYCMECRALGARRVRHQASGIEGDAPVPASERYRGKPEGSTYIHRGYVKEKRTGHHRADKNGWVSQHILVAEEKYGMPITQEFTVHHRNANRSDNRPENLDLRLGQHGYGGEALDVLMHQPGGMEAAAAILRRAGWHVDWPSQQHA